MPIWISRGDGLSNWQETLLGSDPTVRKTLQEQTKSNGQEIHLTYARPQGSITSPWVCAEFSDGLAAWGSPDGSRMSERILSTRDGVETVEMTLLFSGGSTGFFRLKMKDAPTE